MAAGTGSVPRFEVGDGYAVFRGATTDGPLHRHTAFQIAVAGRGEVTMADAAGDDHRAAVPVVPPMVPHRLFAAADLVTFFVEPQCVFADRLRERCGTGITAAPELRELREEQIARAGREPSADLDPRLVAALNILRARSIAMPALAAEVGLSPQRLRALARAQAGMPLARWRVWTRLHRAAAAMRAGRSPAEAAVAAGFADQAHLTRWLREMMGLTPAVVVPILRGQARRAT